MRLKCNRYVFAYTSNPEIVEDYICRSDDLARKTYGRDEYFSRLNQVLDFARFLGWDIPRFGSNLPAEVQEIPLEGINHIFENQIKILIDLAPTTKVMLENGKYCAVRMLCGTTAAGDLVWKLHLLNDRDGCPYVVKNGKKFKAKTRGTQIVCQNETLPYDENYLIEIFGGDQGIWPVPFLPEFFSDQLVAHLFSPDDGVIEVVRIDEQEPVVVLAKEMVPWYRTLSVDLTKALTMEDDFYSEPVESAFQDYEYEPEEKKSSFDVPGWESLADGEQFDLDGEDAEEDDLPEDLGFEDDADPEIDDQGISFTNLIVPFSESELINYQETEKRLSDSGISNKKEAEELRSDPANQQKAEQWFNDALTRLRINANCSAKLGAVMSLLEKHKDSQVLIIQPRQKWAQLLTDTLNKKGINAHLFTKEDSKALLRQFYEGSLQVLVAIQPIEDLFIDDLIIISVSSFSPPGWVDALNPSHLAYAICVEQLGYEDHNFISQHPQLAITNETYNGPTYDVLKLQTPKVKDRKPKAKFLIKIENGKDKTLSSYKKALEFVKKAELDGKKCQIFSPDKGEAVYISGIGELD